MLWLATSSHHRQYSCCHCVPRRSTSCGFNVLPKLIALCFPAPLPAGRRVPPCVGRRRADARLGVGGSRFPKCKRQLVGGRAGEGVLVGIRRREHLPQTNAESARFTNLFAVCASRGIALSQGRHSIYPVFNLGKAEGFSFLACLVSCDSLGYVTFTEAHLCPEKTD